VPMSAEDKRSLYRALRRELLAIVGPICAICGIGGEWHFDHTGGTRTYEARRMNSIQRMRTYLSEARAGKGRRLCPSCNGSDGATRSHVDLDSLPEECPF
jgi:hypothetical protein